MYVSEQTSGLRTKGQHIGNDEALGEIQTPPSTNSGGFIHTAN